MSLSLEFEVPGDSQVAHRLVLTLLDEKGGEDTLRAKADRTGEARVVLRGAAKAGKTYVAVRIQAPLAIGLRRLRLLHDQGDGHP